MLRILDEHNEKGDDAYRKKPQPISSLEMNCDGYDANRYDC